MMQSARTYLPFEIRELGWAVAEGQTDAYPFQVRFRCFPADFPESDYSVRLNVFWRMENPLDDGLASSIDMPLMQQFEERMVRTSELSGASVLAAVLTGRGEREFIFQVRSAEDFMHCLNTIPQEAAPYPIQLFSSHDPDWAYFHNILGDET